MDNNSNIGNLMETTMSKIREMVDVDTIIGTPINTPDGIMIIPISKVSYAFGGGGGDYPANSKNGFGGGSGAGVKIEPIGFLVVKDGNVRMVNITPPAANTVDRVIEKAPELVELVEDLIDKHKKDKDEA
ncbi:MAG: GerW family sporulation protein [Butyricicoccus sp.]|nr:GerW family sporulation protein [Butyricicoccus sp.]